MQADEKRYSLVDLTAQLGLPDYKVTDVVSWAGPEYDGVPVTAPVLTQDEIDSLALIWQSAPAEDE